VQGAVAPVVGEILGDDADNGDDEPGHPFPEARGDGRDAEPAVGAGHEVGEDIDHRCHDDVEGQDGERGEAVAQGGRRQHTRAQSQEHRQDSEGRDEAKHPQHAGAQQERAIDRKERGKRVGGHGVSGAQRAHAPF